MKNVINILLSAMIAVSIMAYQESQNPNISIWHIAPYVVLLIIALAINISHDGRSLHDYIEEIKRSEKR